MWEEDKVEFIALPVPSLQVVTPPYCSRGQHETQSLDLNLDKRQVSPPDTSRVMLPDTCWSYLLTSSLAPTCSSPTWLMVITDGTDNTDPWVPLCITVAGQGNLQTVMQRNHSRETETWDQQLYYNSVFWKQIHCGNFHLTLNSREKHYGERFDTAA